MIKKLVLSLVLILTFNHLFSQQSDYKQIAESLKETIWKNPQNGFELRTTSPDLKSESAVILSRSYETEATSKRKVKYMILSAAVTAQINQITTYHERTLLNDKAAVEDYSSLKYRKKLDNNSSFMFNKIYDEATNYLGVKIIKPDGKEILVNTSEEVLLKNKSSEEKGKLAISGLSVGDIIDFYICYVEKTELGKSFSEVEILNNEYYTMNYSYTYTFSDKFDVSYSNANNCPDFIRTIDDDGNNTYSLKGKNLEKINSNWWVSSYRTYPYFEIIPLQSNAVNGKINKIMSKATGDIESIKTQAYKIFKSDALTYNTYITKALYSFGDAQSSFKNNKEFKAAPVDTIVKRMYDKWRYDNLIDLKERSSETSAINSNSAYSFSFVLEKNNIPHEIIITPSRYWKPLNEISNYSDVSFLIKINGAVPTYLYLKDPYTVYNEIPVYFQGENAYSIFQFKDEKGFLSKNYPIVIPVVDEKLNVIQENLSVSILPDFKKIKINRVVEESGSMKIEDQKFLLTKLDFFNKLGKGQSDLDTRFKNQYKINKPKVTAILSDEETDKTAYFKSLIESQYDTKPEQISNTIVSGTGLNNNDEKLIFSSTFQLNDFIQKAGNNYLLNIGKLIGTISAVKEQELNRKFDVYMPSARVFNYFINITVPDGYNVKGLENLQKEMINQTGDFKSKATLKGKILTLEVTRSYHHNFEKATDWPKIVSLINTAYEFTGQKILLEKI